MIGLVAYFSDAFNSVMTILIVGTVAAFAIWAFLSVLEVRKR